MMYAVDTLKGLLENEDLETVFIFPHLLPDGDTLGAALGMLNIARAFGKTAYVVFNASIPGNLKGLFSEAWPYVAADTLKGIKPDIAIAVDCGERMLFEDRLEAFSSARHTVNIDHHRTNTAYADINIVDREASSAGEMLYTLHRQLGVDIPPEVGAALYAAVVTDTGSLRYSNTRAYTFEVCKGLYETGFDFNALNVALFQTKPFDKVFLLNKVFGTLRRYGQGRIAVVDLGEALKAELQLSEYDTDGIVEFVRDIDGIEVVVFIRLLEPGVHKVSMRSKYDFDVSAVAQQFGGGGHIKAAGFKSTCAPEGIERDLVAAIEAGLKR